MNPVAPTSSVPPAFAEESVLTRMRSRYLTQALELEERRAPLILPLALMATATLVVGAVVWAAWTRVPEVAMTSGIVMPAGRMQTVQHLEGGIIETLLVGNGDPVAAGQLLATLAAAPAESDNLQVAARRAALTLKLARLTAQLEGREWLEPPAAEVGPDPALLARERALLAETLQSRRAQLEVLERQALRGYSEAEGLRAQIEALSQESQALERKREAWANARIQAVIPETDRLDLEARVARATADVRQLQTSLASAEHAAGEAELRAAEFRQRMREEDFAQIEETGSLLDETTAQQPRTDDRLRRLELRAPVAGTVQALTVHGTGEVLAPGGTLLEIVPAGAELEVEARVSTVDIGHVHAGQEVDVRVHSYEPERFGTVRGEVAMVSASTYLDENEQPYYKAVVRLDQQWVGDDPRRSPLMNGMTVDAQIILGDKSILDYLLKPVYRGLSQAFRER
jgi:membrane fusion protein, adhesin transport system